MSTKKPSISITEKAKPRKYINPIKQAIPVPDLVEVQKDSYKWFIEQGLRELFDEISPIRDFGGRDLELSFTDYYLDEPKFDENTSKEKNITFEAPLRVKTQLVFKKDKKKKEQEIYLGDFPVMTDRGTFIINGIERAVVSQIIRSAGVFFTSNFLRGNKYYGAKIIPNRGAWLEIETDANKILWVKIDRKRKVAVTSLLRAFGYSSNEDILKLFSELNDNNGLKYIKNTLEKDTAANEDDGLIEVYKRIRPGDLATADNAKGLIYSMFFKFERYDFSKVGRYKINQRFGYDIPNTPETRILRREDLIDVIKEIIRLNVTQEDADDIDHLSNRRIRAVGELIQNKFRIGLARTERIVRDKMSTVDMDSMTSGRLINAKPVMGVVKEFFMSSQLSQFMDQTNPLAELEHKRRISALGPGGLSRERAGFEVRDVHTTHYGRICPIATPEGPNIGLVGHLATYARVNEYGFIETPYQVVHRIALADVKDPITQKIIKKGQKIPKNVIDHLRMNKTSFKASARVSEEIVYLNALEEERSVTTSATTPIDSKGYFMAEKIEARKFNKPEIVDVEQIDYMDVASNQILSISTSCIPFVEHDEAARALMGTNMQRQAVPCIKPVPPLVGTGMEEMAAFYSGHVAVCLASGKVSAVDGGQIEVIEDSGKVRHYDLNKFKRSNQSSSINQHPTVNLGERVKKGQVMSDGTSISEGELALGQNVFVAFMTWQGYNYEDAIILSERVVQKDYFTSIHIENYQVEVRETKLGPEVVTSDIPNIGEEKLKNLDETGIIRIGAEVASGDILVGKITPKGETELSAEEKLLRAIFGEKARDVRDSSLYLEHGDHGKVIDVKIFSQEKGDKLSPGVIEMVQVAVADLRKIQVGDKMAGRHGNKGIISNVVPIEDMPFMENGTPIDIVLSPLGVVSRMNLGQILETHLGFAVQKLGFKVATPVLYGVTEKQIKELLKEAGYPESGQVTLINGKTGDAFEKKITVGYKYMLKLNHMVEDKIHQRSIGPYSLITQQPLGGKAQFGGQRFGEMEVWALEGYGAAHTLQEILTIKSDDVPGRSKAYEAIIKGEPIRRLNIPESFNVLVRELKGLGLDVELLKDGKRVMQEQDTKKKK